ncbi:distal tail protein Dit, partial [Lactococcus lactis]|uniref:distal tail protein Dit n=1 Tax=Lactococcus lactis TaxID=1358 RepID=UPI00177BA685
MKKVMKITYGGAELSKFFDSVTNIKRNIGSTWENSTEKLGNGVDFLYNSRGSKGISFDYVLKGIFFSEINHNKEQLASLVNTKEPIELIFEDEPNKVWLALPDGEQSFDLDSGTLNFLVPSGEAVSVDTKKLNEANSGGELGTITHNADGSTTVIINNAGTLETPPVLSLTSSSENGYYGIATVNGVMEIGNKEEIDGFDYTQSETLINAKTQADFTNNFSPSTLAYSPQSSIILANGSLAWKTDGLRATTFGTGSSFHGGQQVFEVPADSEGNVGAVNFRSDFNIFARADSLGQTGLMQVMFTDADDKFLFGYGVYKIDNKANTAKFKFWDSDKKERSSIDFKANNAEK